MISTAPADLVQRRSSYSSWQCWDKPGFLVCFYGEVWVVGECSNCAAGPASLRSAGRVAAARTSATQHSQWTFLALGFVWWPHPTLSQINFKYLVSLWHGNVSWEGCYCQKIVRKSGKGERATGTKPPLLSAKAGSSRVLDVKTLFASPYSWVESKRVHIGGFIHPLKGPHRVHLKGHTGMLGFRLCTTNR